MPSAAPIAGECTPQNGLRVCISASCFDADDKCGLPNSESCGPPTNDAVCRSGVCFQRDAKCGLPKGEACTSATVCRSAICAADGRCGECKADKDCGGPQSARVCDEKTSLCVDGCRGASKPTVDASKPAVDASAPVEAAPTTEGESQGCACDAAGASGSGTGAMAVLGLFGTFAIAARRRVRRESRSEKESV
jgi:MYXO-CTERM domain-containing protein